MNRDDLCRAAWRPVDEASRAAHLAAIEAAVDAAPVRVSPIAHRRRRLAVAAMAAALFILPAGIALAAEGALPGDALFPVKKLTEQIRSLVDDDVVAQHRIEELEQLVAEQASPEVIAEQFDRAAAEVARLEGESDLVPRFAAATDNLPNRDVNAVADPPTGTTVPPPRVTTSTAPITDTTVAHTTVPDTTVTLPPGRTTTTAVAPSTTLPRDITLVPVVGIVTAGPTCPVQRFPPDPDCEDQPVNGAIAFIETELGEKIAEVTTGAEGRFEVQLPAGKYLLIPQPFEGLLGTAAQQAFEVGDKAVELLVGYDTGIR